MVHVQAGALDGRGGESDVPLPTVRRLCCDGGVVPLLEDDQGNVLSVGRKQRTVPTAIKRALMARDRCCRFPGCHHERFVDAHHIQHWADGGETSLENLLILCTHHHTLIHEEGFRVGRRADGTHYFARPDGRPIEVSPPAAGESPAGDRQADLEVRERAALYLVRRTTRSPDERQPPSGYTIRST